MKIRQPIDLTAAQRKLLTRTRTAMGITPAQLADSVGVSRPMIAMIESGQKPAPVALLARITGQLGLDFSTKIVVEIKSRKKRK